MYKVKDLYNYIDEIAPFKMSEKWDNSGLIIGNFNKEVSNCVFALDITNKVIDKAIKLKSNLIITHHPVIFNPIKQIPYDSIVYRLIENNISVISAHTNLDKAEFGISQILAEKLKLNNIKTLDNSYTEKYYKIIVFVPKNYLDNVSNAMSKNGAGKLGNYSECAFASEGIGCFKPNELAKPYIGKANELKLVNEIKLEMICSQSDLTNVINAMIKSHPYESVAYDIFENKAINKKYGFCKMGELPDYMYAKDFALYTKQLIKTPTVRFCEGNKKIKNVALISGGASSMIDIAIKNNADAFITGDIKHDVFINAIEKGITLVDIGHYESEIIIFENLKKQMENKFNNLKFEILDKEYNPIKYI